MVVIEGLRIDWGSVEELLRFDWGLIEVGLRVESIGGRLRVDWGQLIEG